MWILAISVFFTGLLFAASVAAMVRRELGKTAAWVSAAAILVMVTSTAFRVLVVGGGQ
jgi:hypothetical protein